MTFSDIILAKKPLDLKSDAKIDDHKHLQRYMVARWEKQ